MSQKKRVVLACQVFYPDAQSTSQLFTQLFEHLAASPDLELTAICGYPSALRIGTGPVPKQENWKGIRIIRCGMQVDVKRSMFTRLVSYFTFMLHAFWKLLRVPRDATVVGVTNPPFMGILLYFVSKVRRIRYQYYMLDLYPEGMYLSDLMKPNSLTGKTWEWLNRRAYRRADKLLLLGRDMGPLLEKRYGVDPQKNVYIPHWAVFEPTELAPFAGNPMSKELGLEDKFVVQYSGNMGLWHDMETFVRAAAALKEEDSIRFLFIGGGRRRKGAEALAKELKADNIIWRDFVPKEQLNTSLACCHVSLVSLREGLEGIAVPCKIYGILASGRPMIAQVPEVSEVAMVVREEDCGIIVKPGDIEGVTTAIRTLAQDRERARAMGQRGFDAYRKKYTLKSAVKTFRDLWGGPASQA